MKKGFIMIMTVVISFTLLGCTSIPNNDDNTFIREEVSITHSVLSGAELGESGTSYDTTGLNRQEITETFLTNPSRVAIFSYDALDMLDYVGIDETSISLLGIVQTNIPTFLSAYESSDYEHVGTLFLPDYDVLDLFQPELIILGSRSTGAYDALKEQYPNADILDVTLIFGEYLEGLTRNAQNLAKIFPSVADDLQNTLDEIVDDMTIISDMTNTHEALFILVNGQALSFYGPTGRYAVLYDEFGFIPADDNVDSGGSHGDLVGYEYVSAVDPEVLFLLDRAAAIGNESTLDAVLNNSLVTSTEAGQNSHIYALNGEAWYIASGGFTSTLIMISDIQAFIDDITA